MKRFYCSTRIYTASLLCIILCSAAVAETAKALDKSDYNKLCDIFKNVSNESIDLASKEMKLTEEVQNNLPELFDNLFIHIIRSRADKRYQLISQYARQQDKVIWKCEAARSYYTDQF